MALEQAAGHRRELDESQELDWNAVYADQAPRVYNYFRFRLGRDADIEELTARTFERAWRSRAHYRSDLAAFSTWLFKIAQNVHKDYLRSRHGFLPIDAAVDIAADGTPEKEAERTSNLTRLALLTRDLPERERELIALKYGAEINNRLIARLTGLSESNVGTILHRVVQTLRSRW
jgi:RNA polymerase sigma-70 factor, ECF subfamily